MPSQRQLHCLRKAPCQCVNAASKSGRNRSLDGGTHFHSQTKCRARAPGEQVGHRRGRRGIAWRFGGRTGGDHHVLDRDLVQENRRDHLCHRRHCLPDQYFGVECSGGSGACRRTRPRIRRGRIGGAHAGATVGRCRKRDQTPDRRFGEQGGARWRKGHRWCIKRAPP